MMVGKSKKQGYDNIRYKQSRTLLYNEKIHVNIVFLHAVCDTGALVDGILLSEKLFVIANWIWGFGGCGVKLLVQVILLSRANLRRLSAPLNRWCCVPNLPSLPSTTLAECAILKFCLDWSLLQLLPPIVALIYT